MKLPTWTYFTVDLPNFDAVQNELSSDSMIAYVKEFAKDKNAFNYIRKDEMFERIPETLKMLRELGLEDRLKYLGFILVKPGAELPIHMDSPTPEHRCYALNLPVLNAKNSYTVFYHVTGKPHFKVEDYDDKISYNGFYPEQILGEADRVEVDRPYWMNINFPHKPEVLHDQERIICSLRFEPEIHDWFAQHYPDL